MNQAKERYVVGAYAAAPPHLASDPAAEDEWYAALGASPLVGGLELPFIGTLHPSGVGRLAELVEPGWRSVVTTIPGVGKRLAVDATYGLASRDPRGREAAVADVRVVFDEVRQLRSAVGPEAIQCVAIASAPGVARDGFASPGSGVGELTESLAEVASWEWDGVALSLEHCDAPRGHGVPQKGYLSLDDELRAVAAAGRTATTIGHTVNWARSVIEVRDPMEAVTHLEAILERGTLAGLMFSGVSPVQTGFGGPWVDAHLPVASPAPGSEPTSLLTPGEIAKALVAATNSAGHLGVKVGPGRDAPNLLDRLGPTFATLSALNEADTAGDPADIG